MSRRPHAEVTGHDRAVSDGMYLGKRGDESSSAVLLNGTISNRPGHSACITGTRLIQHVVVCLLTHPGIA